MQTVSHLSVLIHEQAKKYGDREVMIYKDFGGVEWKSYSWNGFSDTVKVVSNALLNLGVRPQENVGIFSQNCVQYLFTDFGAWGVRAVTIPFYATSSEQQIQFMVNDARCAYSSSESRNSMTRPIGFLPCATRWSALSSSIVPYA